MGSDPTHSTSTVESIPAKQEVVGEEPGLGRRAARGAALLVCNTLLAKVLNFGCQIGIAWFLTPDDFGLVSLTLTVVLLLTTAQNAGVRTVLVRRQADFERLQNPAFWFCVALGLAGSLICLAAGPIAAIVYGEPRIVNTCAIASVSLLLHPLSTVGLAGMQIHLRFRSIILSALAETLTYQPGILLLAWMGYGPYSFFLSWAGVAVAKLIVTCLLFPLRLLARLELPLWRELVSDSILMIAARLLQVLNGQLAFIVLGYFFTNEATGFLFFASGLALQPVFFLSGNLETVLLPTLAKMGDDPLRQKQAYVRAIGLLCTVSFPISYVAAGVADPLIRAVFHTKWVPAIPAFVALCLGVPFVIVGNSAQTILQARGRFKYYLALMASMLAVLLPLVALALAFSTPDTVSVHVAVAMSAAFVAQGLATFVLAARPQAITATELATAIFRPLLAGLTGLVGGLLGAWFGRTGQMSIAGSLATAVALASVGTAVGMWLFARRASAELLNRVSAALVARRPKTVTR